MTRIVLHLDMDAFFASVEELDHPRLKGMPIVVGADPKDGGGRGVVSTANYAARKYGIHSAMPISTAWKLSEEAAKRGESRVVFMGVNMKRYAEVSHEIMSYLGTLAESFEPASVDEAYLEISSSLAAAEKLAREIKTHIKKVHGLTCTIGIGPNKLISKIAAQEKKPDGLTVVLPEEVMDFLAPKAVLVLPGVGPKTSAVLLKIGIKTVSDLRSLSQADLREKFGKWGIDIYRKARGEDDSPVTAEYETKSIGEQETFENDTLDPNLTIGLLKDLSAGVYFRIKKQNFSFKAVGITVRFSDFETKTRIKTLPDYQNDLKTIERETLQLFLPFLDRRENPQKKKIRLIGVRVEKLE